MSINPFEIIAGAVSDLAKIIVGALDDDSPEKVKAKAELLEVQQRLELAAVQADTEIRKIQAGVITSETTGHSWLQRNWRPITALTFTFTVLHNIVLAPYGRAIIGDSFPLIDTPVGLWSLLTVMIGGYTIGRTMEKRAMVERVPTKEEAEAMMQAVQAYMKNGGSYGG